jgi:hypothetical protein
VPADVRPTLPRRSIYWHRVIVDEVQLQGALLLSAADRSHPLRFRHAWGLSGTLDNDSNREWVGNAFIVDPMPTGGVAGCTAAPQPGSAGREEWCLHVSLTLAARATRAAACRPSASRSGVHGAAVGLPQAGAPRSHLHPLPWRADSRAEGGASGALQDCNDPL